MKTALLFVMLIGLGCTGRQSEVIIKNYMIAYNIHVPDTTRDDWEVMVMNVDGSDKRNLTQHPDVAWTYSAWDNRLYFVSDRDTSYRCYFLYEMNASGENIRKVSTLRLEDSSIGFRDNGGEIVVAGRIGKEIRHQLFLINTSTGDYRQLTTDTAARHGDPAFSPDGKQIVFSYKKNRRDRTSHEELYVMNYDGSGMRQLTHYPEDNSSASESGFKAAAARWHPSVNFISYVSQQDGRHSIFAITPDGSKQWKLLESDQAEIWHNWSPDGKWLVYNHSDIAESQFHVSLMNWETKENTQLTDDSLRTQQSPVFVRKDL